MVRAALLANSADTAGDDAEAESLDVAHVDWTVLFVAAAAISIEAWIASKVVSSDRNWFSGCWGWGKVFVGAMTG